MSQLDKQRVKLAASGNTPYDYRVSLSESETFFIEWVGRQKQFTLTFTPEEIHHLLQFLLAHREQIERGYHEWVNSSGKDHPF